MVPRAIVTAFLLALLLSAGPSQASELALRVVGNASDPASGELLYREYHYCSRDGQRCVVEYRETGSELIALKHLDYAGNPIGPALSVRDFRLDTRHSIDYPTREDLVVDAGFDNFVRSRWQKLVDGEEVVFPFQVVGLDRPLDMTGRSVPGDCDDQTLCLQIQVHSWFLGLLAEPIYLAYDRAERRLLRFTGVSNLRDADGDSQDVDISYLYGAQQAMALNIPATRSETADF
jgi:hypothetical protein